MILSSYPESIYIHIPFCKSKCPYCDFASWAGKENLIDEYFDSLMSEIKTKCEAYLSYGTGEPANRRTGGPANQRTGGPANRRIALSPYRPIAPSPIRSIFIGGGTPSLIAPEYYEKLFKELDRFYKIDKDCEITLELNPGTARDDYLTGYKKLGINRVSIGVQSFNDDVLVTLGRKHSVNETIEAINMAKRAGFENINFDFIFSVPGMTKEIWVESICRALEFNPKHISAYSLIIEGGTPFENIYKDPKKLPGDDISYEYYFELCNILKKAGFIHYEVSNFAKPGFECFHNLTYWSAKEYFAFGVGAHRFINGLRTSNIRELKTYILHPYREEITDFPINHAFEKIMLTSRLTKGFDLNLIQEISAKSQVEIKNMLNDLSNAGFLELSRDKIHLTEKGLFVNNEILLKLI